MERNIRVDWPAVWIALISLILVGATMGWAVKNGDTSITCPSEDWVVTEQTENGVAVFCLDPLDQED